MGPTLLGITVFCIFAYMTASTIRALSRRRAALRNMAFSKTEAVKIPCRISYEAEIGNAKFVYGKLLANPEGMVKFSRRGRDPVNMPQSEWVHREKSWRTGLVILRYSTLREGDIKILLSEADADTVEKVLRAIN